MARGKKESIDETNEIHSEEESLTIKFSYTRISAVLQYFALLCVVLLVSTSFFPQSLGEGWGAYPAPEYGDWTITNNTTVSNEMIILTGNLVIGDGGVLTLENVTLVMNISTNGEYGITVETGGVLRVLNSTITGNSGYHYSFEVDGKLTVYQSTVEYLWGETSSQIGGIQVYSDDVTISYSNVSNSMASAIYSDGHYPRVSFTTLNDSVYGLFLENVEAPSPVTISTFWEGLTEENITMPSDGGDDTSAIISIPDQAVIIDASFNVTGLLGEQEYSVMNTTFDEDELSESANVTITGGDVELDHGPVSYFNETNVSDFNDGTFTRTQVTNREGGVIVGGEFQLNFSGIPGLNRAPAYGTASASSSDVSYPASNAIDNNTGTKWRSSSGSVPQWLSVDMGNGNNHGRAIKKIEFVANDASNKPKNFLIQTAPWDNPSSWTTQTTVTNNNLATWSTTYSTPIWARYVRIYITATTGGMPTYKPTIHEFRVHLAAVYTNGTYVSSVLDAEDPVGWKEFTTTIWEPEETGGSYSIATRTSYDSSTWTDWIDIDESPSKDINSPPGQYLQYCVTIIAGDGFDNSYVFIDTSVMYRTGCLFSWTETTAQDFLNGTCESTEVTDIGEIQLSAHNSSLVSNGDFGYDTNWAYGELDGYSAATGEWNETQGKYDGCAWDNAIDITSGSGEYGIDQWIDQWISTEDYLLPSNVTLTFSRKFTTSSNDTASITPKAQLYLPNCTWVDVWAGDSINDDESEYTNVTVNITEYFTELGSYKLRLFTGMSATLSSQSIELHNYWDDVAVTYSAMPAQGTFVSQVFDAGMNATWDWLSSDFNVSDNTGVMIRAISSRDLLNWTEWSDFIPDTEGSEPGVEPGRYFKYMLQLNTSAWNETPIFSEITLDYTVYESTGYIISVPTEFDLNITSARPVINATLQNQTATVFVSNDNGTTWYYAPNDTRRDFPGGGAILRYKVVLGTGDTSATPTLHEITIYYTVYHYPTNASIDVGGDGETEWNTSGEFSSTQLIDDDTTDPSIIREFQDYVDLNSAPENLSIPIGLYSSTGGSFQLTDLYVEFYIPFINNNTFLDNTYGVYLSNCTDLTVIGSTFRDLDYGLKAVNSDVSVTDCSFWNMSTKSLWMTTASEVAATNTTFNRALATAEDTSTLDARRYLYLTVLEEDGTLSSGLNVIIKDKDAVQVFSGSTDSSGTIPVQALTEFTLSGSTLDFKTPHTITTANPYGSNASVFMDGPTELSIYRGGDADNDTIDDWSEGWQDIYGFEAENRIYDDSQLYTDYLASGYETAISPEWSGVIFDESIAEMAAGSYRIAVRAAGDAEDAAMELRVNKSDDTVLVEADEFLLRTDLDWYTTPEFTLSSTTVLDLSIEDSGTGDAKACIDRILIIRTKDEYDNPLSNDGQRSDPLMQDSDGDGLRDGYETRGESWWFEAEDHDFSDSYLVQECNASNSQAISRCQNDDDLVDDASFDIPLETGNYTISVFCRANESVGDSADIRVNFVYDGSPLSDTTFTVHSNYSWNTTEQFYIDTAEQSISLIIEDATPGDPFGVYLDRILLTRVREDTAGSSLWNASMGTIIGTSSPAIEDGKVFFVADSTVYAYLGSGSQNWTANTATPVRGSVAVANGIVYLGTDYRSAPQDYGALKAFSAEDGDELWRSDLPAGISARGTPAVFRGQLFILLDNGSLNAYDAQDGTLQWSTSFGASGIKSGTAPVADEENVYAGAYNGSTAAIVASMNRSTGAILWYTDYTTAPIATTPVLADGCLFFGTDDGYIVSYSIADGNLEWQPLSPYTISSAPIESSPALSNGLLIFGAEDAYLRAVSEQDGALEWEVSLGAALASSPAISNNEVFIGTGDGYLSCYALENGSFLWRRDLGGTVDSSPALADLDGDGHLEIVVGHDDTGGNYFAAFDGGGAYYRGVATWSQFHFNAEHTGNLQYQAPYYTTSALSADTDLDTLGDGRELFGFYGFDRVEFEDVEGYDLNKPSLAEPTNIGFNSWVPSQYTFFHQTGVTLTASYNFTTAFNAMCGTYLDSWTNLSFTPETSGMYRLAVPLSANSASEIEMIENSYDGVVIVKYPVQDRQISSWANNYAEVVLMEATNLNLSKKVGDNDVRIWPVNGTESEEALLKRLVQPEGANPEDGPVLIWGLWGYQGVFNLTANIEYTITVSTNLTRVVTEKPEDFNWSVKMARIMDLDYLRVERQTLDPFNPDADLDAIPDGEEAASWGYPLNSDADEDGLDDRSELNLGTDPGMKDTDLDGIRDRIELGYGPDDFPDRSEWLDTPSKASWTERIQRDPEHEFMCPPDIEIYNYDYDWDETQYPNATVTDPLNPDSDYDGVPDGWRDGWTYDPTQTPPDARKTTNRNNLRYRELNYWRYNESGWGLYLDKVDNKVQIFEGEDFNGDGTTTTGHAWGFTEDTFEPVSINPSGDGEWNNETRADDEDSDGDRMADGYEIWYSHLEPWKSGSDYILDPTVDDAGNDVDQATGQSSGEGCEDGTEEFEVGLSGSPIDGTQGLFMNFTVANSYVLAGMELNLKLSQNTEAVLEFWDEYTVTNYIDFIQPVSARLLYDVPPMAALKQPVVSKTLIGESDAAKWYRIDTPDVTLEANVDYYIVLWYADADVEGDTADPDPGFSWLGKDIGIGKAASYDFSDGSWTEGGFDLNFRLTKYQGQPDGLTNLREYLLATNPKKADTDCFGAGNTQISDGLLDGQEVLWSLTHPGGTEDSADSFSSWDDRYLGYEDTVSEGSISVAVNGSRSSLYLSYIMDPDFYYVTLRLDGLTGDYLNMSFLLVSEGNEIVNEHFFLNGSTDGSAWTNLEEDDYVIYPSGTFVSFSNALNNNTLPSTYYVQLCRQDNSEYAFALDSIAFMRGTGALLFRTDVENGSYTFDNYMSATSASIYFDGDSEAEDGHAMGDTYWMDQPYRYDCEAKYTDPEPGFAGNGKFSDNLRIFTLEDGATIYMNRTNYKIYVWSPETDFETVYLSEDGEQYISGQVAVFARDEIVSNMGSEEYGYSPDPAFRGGELYMSSPFDIDTDDDGLLDGQESGPNHPLSWRQDWDWEKNGASYYGTPARDPDGLVGVRDTDSDNDGVLDGQERTPTLDFLADNVLSMDNDDDTLYSNHVENIIDPDSDGDGIWDGNETQLKYMLDVDADDDGLVDGWLDGYIWNGDEYESTGEGTSSEFDDWEGEDANLNGTADNGETAPNRADTDRDGLADGYDIIYDKASSEFYNLSRERIPFIDLGDNTVKFWGELTDDHTSAQTGQTNQTNPDTDADSLSDYKELVGYVYKYVDRDGEEQTLHVYMDPLDTDTDSDGLIDKIEYQHSNASASDSDFDGLPDNLEDNDKNGRRSPDEPDAIDADSDDDGMLDGNLGSSGSPPLNETYPAEDLDNDGTVDANESSPILADSDGDGVHDLEEYTYSDTYGTHGYADSDWDGLINLLDADSDDDGLDDAGENWDFDGVKDSSESDALDPDSDNDGLYDGAEPAPFTDADNDTDLNINDDDSNEDTVSDDTQTYVTFRTDAIDADGDGKNNYTAGTWIAVDPTGANLSDLENYSLELRGYEFYESGVSSVTASGIYISFGIGSEDLVPVRTPDGYEVLVKTGDSNTIYIEIAGDSYIEYHFNSSSVAETSINSVDSYVKLHQETYDYRPAVNMDSDFDGLSNIMESGNGTGPLDRDSDDDGVCDGAEQNWNLSIDDDDGIINALDPDSDDDGITDGTELGITAGVYTFSSVLGTDSEATYGDGRLNFTADADPTTTTDPLSQDSDGDGLLDGWDDANSDGDRDSGETAGEDLSYDGAIAGDTNHNNRWDAGETWTETSATDIDSDDDGLGEELEGTLGSNPLSWDSDADGIFDGTEYGLTTWLGDTDVTTGHFIPDADPAYTTDPIDIDCDSDGLADGAEDKNHNGAFDNGTDETNATDTDTDRDGLTDGEEVNGFYMTINGAQKKITTDPLTNDTDGDGIVDGTERNGYAIGPDGNRIWTDIQTDPSNIDTDADGLNDGQEAKGWEICIFYERSLEVKENRTVYSNPLIIDTDSDNIIDFYEFQNSADPNAADTDKDLIPDTIEIYPDNGSQRSNPCGIEGTPPKLSKLNTGYVAVISTWNGISYCSGWNLQISVYAEDTSGIATITFTLNGFFGTKSQVYRFGECTKAGLSIVNFDVEWTSAVLLGYNLNITAEDGNENIGFKVTHIQSITEQLVDSIVGELIRKAKPMMEFASIMSPFLLIILKEKFEFFFNNVLNLKGSIDTSDTTFFFMLTMFPLEILSEFKLISGEQLNNTIFSSLFDIHHNTNWAKIAIGIALLIMLILLLALLIWAIIISGGLALLLETSHSAIWGALIIAFICAIDMIIEGWNE